MTQAFLESLEAAEPRGSYRLILVDNGSTDATAAGLRAWKKRLPFTLIRNRRNLGVAPAWNQGVAAALKAQASWVGILNNDLLLTAGCLTRLRQRAEDRGWALASPATREGVLGYDLRAYASAYTRRCQAWDQEGSCFGWCFLVQAAVFRRIGRFDENFLTAFGEDMDFFLRAQSAGFACGTTGASFVHHFCSVTTGPLRKKRGKDFEDRNLSHLRRKHDLGRRKFFSRRWVKLSRTLSWLRWGHLMKES
jgi:N-acetylglucosaminyl-diphospho-decaprenol L-rhamnosyltransferase